MSTLIPEQELSIPIPDASRNNSLRLLELALVTTIAFGRPLVRSLFALFGYNPAGNYSDNATLILAIVNEVASLGLLAYVLFRQGSSWRTLLGDWKPKDILIAIGLFLYYFFAVVFFYLVIQKTAYSLTGHYLIPKDAKGMLGLKVSFLSVLFVFVNPLFEELIVRAYLMTEIMNTTGSKVLAIAASAILQTAYHLYQGGLNASMIAIAFLIMSIYFAKTRRIGPIVLLHFGLDASALFL